MKILGLDPGTATTGYGLIETDGVNSKILCCGVIKTIPSKKHSQRLLEIHNDVSELIKKHKPDACAVEQLFFANNQKTAFSVGQARGILLLAIEKAGLPLHEFTPLQVKQALVGYGKADKKQVQKMVQVVLGLNAIPKPDDAADALAIALTCAGTKRWGESVKFKKQNAKLQCKIKK